MPFSHVGRSVQASRGDLASEKVPHTETCKRTVHLSADLAQYEVHEEEFRRACCAVRLPTSRNSRS